MAEPSTTVSYIFDQAIKLMDEQDDIGKAIWSDTVEYQNRVIAIMNTLIGECFPFSDTYAVTTPGKRPIAQPVESLDSVVCLDDSIAKTVLPYGLAAELIKNDDPALGNYFLQRYQEQLARHARTLPAAWDTVEDFYGGLGYTNFARW
jgi:hypothetical protein